MSNPVLARGFRTQQPAYAPVQYQQGQPQGYQVPQQGYPGGYPGQPTPMGVPQAAEARAVMTLDDIITKSGITLGAMMVVAAITFLLVPLNSSMWLVTGGAALVGFVLAIVVSMRKVVSPGWAIAYAVVEGVFVGGFSKAFEYMYPGIVGQAVLGTFAAALVTLAAYKYLNIQIGQKFRKGLMIAIGAYAIGMLANFLLSFAGINLGLWDAPGQVSWLGVGMVALGTVLAVFSLLTDFDDVRRGIAMGAPASESWRAAFGLTVTMVWLYINILRILGYLRN